MLKKGDFNVKKLDYAAIILNYNTSLDAIQAAESVIEKSSSDNFIVCIADSGSKDKEIEILEKYQHEKVDIHILNKNLGYAKGNNAAVRHVLSIYEVKYLVIMNPDVKLMENGLVENLIEHINENKNAVGGQPIVNNIAEECPSNMQTQIRKVGNYADVLIRNSILLRKILKDRFFASQYGELKPFVGIIEYEVPSGAFFIVNTKTFLEVGMFDEDTFLYGEEEILGFKIKQLGKCFILDCGYSVNHFQGLSTGAHNGVQSRFSCKCLKDSNAVYLKKYLHCGKLKLAIVLFAIEFDYIISIIKYKMKHIIRYFCKKDMI